MASVFAMFLNFRTPNTTLPMRKVIIPSEARTSTKRSFYYLKEETVVVGRDGGGGGHCCTSMGATYVTFWANTDTTRISDRKHTRPRFFKKSECLMGFFVCERRKGLCLCVRLYVCVCLSVSVFGQKNSLFCHMALQ